MSIKGISLRELVSKELPEMSWAVPGLFPEGLTILAGKQKMGKSFLVLNIALGVANGTAVLGKLPVEKKDVLYLALEDGQKRVQERSTVMLQGNDGPDNLIVVHDMLPLDSGGLDEIKEYLDEHPNTGLVVIDVLSRVEHNRQGVDLRTEVYRQLGPLQKLGIERHVAFVAVHHMNRGKGSDDDQDRIYGSSGYAQVADAVVMLDRTRGNPTAKLTVTGRDIEDKTYNLRWYRELLTWGIVEDAETDITIRA